MSKINYKILEFIEDEIVNVGLLKKSLRITHDYDDDLLKQVLDAAIDSAENYTKSYLRKRKIFAEIENYKNFNSEIYLPIRPISYIFKISEISDGLETPLEFSDENINYEKGYINLKKFHKKLNVKYISGYRKIPAPIIQGILIHASEIYDQQNLFLSINNVIANFYRPYRKVRIS